MKKDRQKDGEINIEEYDREVRVDILKDARRGVGWE